MTAPPSTADLVLAYRQAKRAFAMERGSVGLLDFGEFESFLDERLRSLRRDLRDEQWFSRIDIGTTIVVPKSVEPVGDLDEDIVTVGRPRRRAVRASVRLQLAPTPEFAIVEVLYLWEFGPALEALLDSSCVGYRLKRVEADGEVDRGARDIYEHWPAAFESYRDDPIEEARRVLGERGGRVRVTSTDVVSFFDSIDPAFLLDRAFIARVRTAASRLGRRFSARRYRVATLTLLAAFARFREQRRAFGVTDPDVGVPIGALTSRLVANAALAPLDRYIQRQAGVALYRRYVDDIVIVSRLSRRDRAPATKEAVLARVFPRYSGDEQAGRFVVPLTRASFRLKRSKTRIHDLEGAAGIEFLGTVAQSFALVTSERRALFGNIDTLEKEIEALELFDREVDGGDHIPRLRDADRFTLRRFMATAFVRALERCAFLLDHREAARFVERKVRRVLAVLDGGAFTEHVEIVLALLRVAVLLDHKPLRSRLERWLAKHERELIRVAVFRWRDEELRAAPTRRGLRDYLAARQAELVASVCAYKGRGTAHAAALVLRHADLRHLDRDDDVSMFGTPAALPAETIRGHTAILNRVRRSDLAARLRAIDDYLTRFAASSDDAWHGMHALSTLLAARPPTFSDVAARVLAHAPPNEDVGLLVARSVDALRGTRYERGGGAFTASPDGTRRTISIEGHDSPEHLRVIVANLPVDLEAFKSAASGAPRLTLARFRALDDALREAARAVRDARRSRTPALLVLPELSIPRRWTRSVVHHAVRERISLVAGLEYRRSGTKVVNEAMGVFPLSYYRAAPASWTKRYPARKEERYLASLGLSFAGGPFAPRQIVHSAHGRLSVLICSELLEAPALADLRGHLELLVVPAWNDDTGTFDHVTHTVSSMLVHAYVAVANNAEASDSRIVAPMYKPRHLREAARIIQRGYSRVIWDDVPMEALHAFHTAGRQPSGAIEFRPLPPGWP